MKRKVSNVIFFSGKIDLRAGGPSGYIANLKAGLEKNGNNDIEIVVRKHDVPLKLKYVGMARILSCLIPFKTIRKKIRNYLIERFNSSSRFDAVSLEARYYKDFVRVLDDIEFDTITCHWVKDALFIRNYLDSRKSKAKLILMSHSPEPPSEEVYAVEKRSGNPDAEKNYKIWQKIEKAAFCEKADYLLFPSKEAIEPYSSSLPYFESLFEQKQFLFLPTGCTPLATDQSKEQLREKFNIKTKYVVCYVGRHNRIKGYDILQDIASVILEKRDDVTFLIAGKLDSGIPPLQHERWIELGFANPAEVFTVSDVFILPNRQTYFDLILLEALSTGIPVIASATGGNKSVAEATSAISLYSDIKQCVQLCHDFLDLPEEEKEKQRERCMSAYDNNYTLSIFAKNYAEMMHNL